MISDSIFAINQSPAEVHRMRENAHRFRALLAATFDMIYLMSADWLIMRTLDGKGFLEDTEEPTMDWLQKYILPEEHELVKRTIEQAITSKTNFELEHRVYRQDGSVGWVFSRAVPICNENGELTEWFGAASDITQKRLMEKALTEANARLERSDHLYNAITGSTPDLIYAFDLNYHFIYANAALLAMWGTTAEEAMGKKLLQLGYEPWHAEMHEREIDQVKATKATIRGEVSFPHAVLGRRIYDYIFAPVLNNEGNVIAISGTTRDISDLKKAEDALKQSEEQFRSLTQALPQLIWTARPEGYADFFNLGWYDYTGSTPEASYGSAWTNFVHPQHRLGLFNAWQHSVETGSPIVFEFQLLAKNGIYNWFYVLGNPIKDESGEIRKWVGALTNIDEKKAVEEKLEQLVNERTKELQRSNDDLMQFAHVASHDLKEPLRKIKTFANFLETELQDSLSGKSQLYFEKIHSAADRMNYMIEGVLAYSGLANIQNTFEQVNLQTTINNIATDLEVLIQQKQAQLHYKNLPVVVGSPVLLYQLFYNLVYNALKFAKNNETPEIYIEWKYIEQESLQFIQISVTDNGIGFSQKHATEIFNTFTRLNSKDAYEGTGLGLALCKKIVERHNGFITAKGIDGKGAEFIVLLPVI